MPGEVEAIAGEMQRRFLFVGFGSRRHRLRHPGEQPGLIREIQDVGLQPALGARRRNEQDPADRGAQLLEQVFPLGIEPVGGGNRERDALETETAGVQCVFCEFNLVALALQKPRETGS